MENRLGKKLQNNSNGYLKPVPIDLFTRAKNFHHGTHLFPKIQKAQKKAASVSRIQTMKKMPTIYTIT